MPEFKIGDKVRRKHYDHGSVLVGDVRYIIGFDGIGYTLNGDKKGYTHNPQNLELAEETHFPLYSEEAAVKLLKERGYNVAPPPEPLKGKAYVYRYVDTGHVFVKTDQRAGNDCDLIAIVDWTEGDGL
jgi:hypothetical protein